MAGSPVWIRWVAPIWRQVCGYFCWGRTALSVRRCLRGSLQKVMKSARWRGRRGNDLPRVQWVQLDIAKTTELAEWRPQLDDVDAVVNCAGVLQDGPGDNTRGVHVDAADALYRACEETGVQRVVHVSAIGTDRQALSAFSATKKEGEDALQVSTS